MTPNNTQQNVELRLRTMRTLWMGMMLSIVGYFVLTLFAGRSEDLEPNPTLSLILLAVAASAALVSFPLKSKLLNRAIEQQQVPMVQQAYIVAWAITEVGGLLGVLDFFTTGDRYYYLLFMIAALGQLLHFPRREHMLNAWGKSPIV
jgi:drug/metabolite transporter (DMT)-like permease